MVFILWLVWFLALCFYLKIIDFLFLDTYYVYIYYVVKFLTGMVLVMIGIMREFLIGVVLVSLSLLMAAAYLAFLWKLTFLSFVVFAFAVFVTMLATHIVYENYLFA